MHIQQELILQVVNKARYAHYPCPSTAYFLGPTRVYNPNGISIGSDILHSSRQSVVGHVGACPWHALPLNITLSRGESVPHLIGFGSTSRTASRSLISLTTEREREMSPSALYSLYAWVSLVSRRLETWLWPPCVADADIIFSFCFFLSFFFFSSPNLSGRRLDVYHTSTQGVALVRI